MSFMVLSGFDMVWAPLVCVFGMMVDLLIGLTRRQLWFPNKHFTLNAASISTLAVAVKNPMDLNYSIPVDVDQMAKLGSMALLCTMMANSLPSLATLENKEIRTNIVALGVFVVPLVIEVYNQIKDGVYDNHGANPSNNSLVIFYMGATVMLLIIHACSGLIVETFKQRFEEKYQACQEKDINDQELQPLGSFMTTEMLEQRLSRYWIIAGIWSPKFVIACSATGVASGVICAFTCVTYVNNVISFLAKGSAMNYESEDKWAASVVLLTQFVGVVLGTIAPVSRCFAGINFRLSPKWIWDHIKIFEIENYWTQMLYDLKKNYVPSSTGCRTYKIVKYKSKMLILSCYILLQMTGVVICKMIGLMHIFFVICVWYCWKWLKALVNAIASRIVTINATPQRNDMDEDLGTNVLHDMEIADCALKGLSTFMSRLINSVKKRPPRHLINLLKESKDFKGSGNCDSHHVPSLLAEEYLNCWTLGVVTLATIAISLPKIRKARVYRFLRGVSEGLEYARLVEESLNTDGECLNIQEAAKMLWVEVEIRNKWLGYRLKKFPPQVETARQILEFFNDTAKTMVNDVESTTDDTSICANTMYRITQLLLRSYDSNVNQVSDENRLFAQLSSMIADILAACLTNLPKVIALKCSADETDNVEASIIAAARLLAKTTPIINTLKEPEHPNMNPDGLASSDESCLNPDNPDMNPDGLASIDESCLNPDPDMNPDGLASIDESSLYSDPDDQLE